MNVNLNTEPCSAAEWCSNIGSRCFCSLILCATFVSFAGCHWASAGKNTLGVHMYQQGRWNEALQQFHTALSSDPSNPDAYYNLASTYHKVAVAQKDQRLVEQSEAFYNQCLELSPDHVDCHRGLAVLLAESGRPDSGMRLLKGWAGRNPGASAPLVELARLNQEYGEDKVAERYLDQALALNVRDYRAWAAKGQMREQTGDLNQAVRDYQQSLSLNAMQPNLYQRVAALSARIAQNTANGQPSGWTAQPNLPSTGIRRY